MTTSENESVTVNMNIFFVCKMMYAQLQDCKMSHLVFETVILLLL